MGLYHPWTLSPKVIQRLFVFELWIDDAVLIDRSEYDDEYVADQKGQNAEDVVVG